MKLKNNKADIANKNASKPPAEVRDSLAFATVRVYIVYLSLVTKYIFVIYCEELEDKVLASKGT